MRSRKVSFCVKQELQLRAGQTAVENHHHPSVRRRVAHGHRLRGVPTGLGCSRLREPRDPHPRGVPAVRRKNTRVKYISRPHHAVQNRLRLIEVHAARGLRLLVATAVHVARGLRLLAPTAVRVAPGHPLRILIVDVKQI